MTQEEKQLLLKDICARLPYGVKINVPHHYEDEDGIITLDAFWLHDIQNGRKEIKPYLRSMSSMTLVEKIELKAITKGVIQTVGLEDIVVTTDKGFDYFNEHHIDYRNLIPKGLALEAPEGMYKI